MKILIIITLTIILSLIGVILASWFKKAED